MLISNNHPMYVFLKGKKAIAANSYMMEALQRKEGAMKFNTLKKWMAMLSGTSNDLRRKRKTITYEHFLVNSMENENEYYPSMNNEMSLPKDSR